MAAPTQLLMHRIIHLARRAPSVHNTQPWRWRIRTDDVIQLWADRQRQLPIADPLGRNLAISCGAALHHFIVAARALGVEPSVALTPSRDEPDLLASVRLAPGPDAETTDSLNLLQRRRTDRRRFTSWPVPEQRLADLAQTTAPWGAFAVPILDPAARSHTELLLHRAWTTQRLDRRFEGEQRRWVDRSSLDGVPPLNAVPERGEPSPARPSRFAPSAPDVTPAALVEGTDGVIAICTATDDQRAWLEAGMSLSALWLRATREGFSLVPLSQVIEVASTRTALHHDVFAGMAHPQILVRIGWQEITRSPLVPTPRRPLSDLLLSSPAPDPALTRP